MKGKIKINCYITNSLENINYIILIYDKNSNLILKDKMINGKYIAFLSKYGLYKIVVIPQSYSINYILKTNFLYSMDGCKKVDFYFTKDKKIIIKLIDKFYGLKIKRGEINLWKTKIIQ